MTLGSRVLGHVKVLMNWLDIISWLTPQTMGPCESMNVFIHVQKCKNCEITCKKSDLSIEINSWFPHQICMNWTCIWIMEARKKENTGNGNFSGSHFPIQIYCLHSHKLARQPIARLLIWQPISSKYFVLKDDFFSQKKRNSNLLLLQKFLIRFYGYLVCPWKKFFLGTTSFWVFTQSIIKHLLWMIAYIKHPFPLMVMP